MARSSQEVLTAVKANRDRIGSLNTFIQGLKDQVAELIRSGASAAEMQAALDEIFDLEEADAKTLDAALNANVPPPVVP